MLVCNYTLFRHAFVQKQLLNLLDNPEFIRLLFCTRLAKHTKHLKAAEKQMYQLTVNRYSTKIL